MKKNNKNNIESFLQDICGELGITVPPQINSDIVINPGAKTTDSIMENMIRSYNLGRSTNMGKISDLNRNARVVECYAKVPDEIKKLSKQIPIKQSCIKHNAVSGYIGIHLNTETMGIPGEIQFHDPLSYRVKKIADINYRNTRLLTSLFEKAAQKSLSKEEMDMLSEQQSDYRRRCEMERRLFTMLYGKTDLKANLDKIDKSLAGFANQNNGICFKKNYPYSALLADWNFFDDKGKIDETRLHQSIGMIRPHIDDAQSKLCNNVVEVIPKGRIINANDLEKEFK